MRALWTIWTRNDLGFDDFVDVYAQSVEEAIRIINGRVGEEFVEIIGCVGCNAFSF